MNRIVLILAACTLIAGLAGFAYSLSQPAYKDEVSYRNQYQAIGVEPWDEASKKFHELRESQLTSKFTIQDYSLSLVAIAVIVLIITRVGVERVRAPKSKLIVAELGVLSVIVTSAAMIADLFLGAHREQFPWWADSLGIPLAQLIPLAAAMLLWVTIHLLFLRGKFEIGQRIFRSGIFAANYWLSIAAAFSFVLLVESIFSGRFLMIIPGALWIYFYLSLASGRNRRPLAG